VRDDLALVEDLGGLGVEEELLAQAGVLGEGTPIAARPSRSRTSPRSCTPGTSASAR
jgi:hypothetical protein